MPDSDPDVLGIKILKQNTSSLYFIVLEILNTGVTQIPGKLYTKRSERSGEQSCVYTLMAARRSYLHVRRWGGAAGRHLLELGSCAGVGDVIGDTDVLIINVDLKRKHAFFEGRELTLLTTYGPSQTNGVQSWEVQR